MLNFRAVHLGQSLSPDWFPCPHLLDMVADLPGSLLCSKSEGL